MLHQNPSELRALSLWAGLLYLLIIAAGLSAEFAIRQIIVIPNDAMATAQAIGQNTPLARAGLALSALMAAADVGLAVVLFWLFRPQAPLLATLAMVFRLIQAGIIAITVLLYHAAVSLALTSDGAAETALWLFAAQAEGYDLGLFFFGINSLLMAVLIARFPAAPRGLGLAIGAAGAVYLIGSGLRFLAPGLFGAFQPAYLVPIGAETWFCLWLLWQGLRPVQRLQTA